MRRDRVACFSLKVAAGRGIILEAGRDAAENDRDARRISRSSARQRRVAARPFGREWAKHFGVALHNSELRDMNKSLRSRPMTCMDQIEEIGHWLDSLPPNERVRLNSPHSVWGRWHQEFGEPSVTAERSGPTAKLQATNIELQDTLDHIYQ